MNDRHGLNDESSANVSIQTTNSGNIIFKGMKYVQEKLPKVSKTNMAQDKQDSKPSTEIGAVLLIMPENKDCDEQHSTDSTKEETSSIP